MQLLLNEMGVFYQVVKKGSFSGAANELNLSKASVSRHVDKLERSLKAKLLIRTTRQLRLTEEGEKLYAQCQKMMAEMERGVEILSYKKQRPHGLIKISVPPATGQYLLAPLIPQFLAENPDIQLDIRLESQVTDIIKEQYHLVLRAGILADSNLIAQKLGKLPRQFVATKEYIKLYGQPKTLHDLNKHKYAIYIDQKRMLPKEMINFYKEPLIQSNNLEFIKAMVKQGIVIANLPIFMIEKDLKAKRLLVILPKHQSMDDLYAIYPNREFLPAKVRVFIDFIKKNLKL